MNKSQTIAAQFPQTEAWEDRYKFIIGKGKELPELPESERLDKFLIKGCQSRVWLIPAFDGKTLTFKTDSDAAIVKLATANARAEFKAIREAEEDVRPLIGAVAAMDSAEAVYRYALDAVGVANKGEHASALPALVSLAKERKPQTGNRIANDAASAKSFAERFPTATQLRRA